MAHEPDDFDEDDDAPLGFGDTDYPQLNTVEDYSERARRHGVIKEGEKISRELHALLTEIVSECIRWAEAPQHTYSAAYQIGVMMLPEPYDGYVPTAAELELEERRQAHTDERPPAVLQHPGPMPGQTVETPLSLPIMSYEMVQEGETWVVRVIATGEERYRGSGPVSLRAPFPPF